MRTEKEIIDEVRRWIDGRIEVYSESRINNKLEAIELRMSKESEYRVGLAHGNAIAKEAIIRELRSLRGELFGV